MYFLKIPCGDIQTSKITVIAYLNVKTVTWMHTGTTYVNSQTAYFHGTSCRDVDGCSAMEKNAAEEEDEQERLGFRESFAERNRVSSGCE